MDVEEPLTEELLQQLLDAPCPRKFVEENNLGHRAVGEYLTQLLDEKGLKRSEVVRSAGINETHGYQIFTGARGASRDKVLQLSFAMGLSLREANRALQAAGHNQLYAKDRRDAIIIFCLDKGCSLQEVEDQLYSFGEATIC